MRELLQGVVDTHIHGSPSIAPRIDTLEFLHEMDRCGYRAVCLKEHFMPTAGLAKLLNGMRLPTKTQVVGCVVLNRSVGGLNISAIDAAIKLGARQVFMPTVSSFNHCRYLSKVPSFGGGNLGVKEEPICILSDGELSCEARMVAEYMARHDDVTLSMGHMSVEEIDAFLDYAFSVGVKKLVIDHPYFIIGAKVSDVSRWSGAGAYINFTCSSLEGNGHNGHVPVPILEKTLDAVSDDRLVVSTDYGQPYNGSPVIGMLKMMETLLKDLKVPEKRVIAMTHSIPAYLIGV